MLFKKAPRDLAMEQQARAAEETAAMLMHNSELQIVREKPQHEPPRDLMAWIRGEIKP